LKKKSAKLTSGKEVGNVAYYPTLSTKTYKHYWYSTRNSQEG